MEFIGTEVGIKIRSAIKAKLMELGKTVDDELIDYIMVMVANKKEENHMTRDLQPFLETDTVKFTSWLHKVLQKLEQVTVIVTDEEFKISTSAFGKIAKKRKNSDIGPKKNIVPKEDVKEKKKKAKHDHGKQGKVGPLKTSILKEDAITGASVVEKKSIDSSVSKKKVPKSLNLEVAPVAIPVVMVEPITSEEASPSNGIIEVPRATLSVENDEGNALITEEMSLSEETMGQELAKSSSSSSLIASPSVGRIVMQRPVMMVSDDDDDDDDDFINIKTDMAEAEELLGDDRAALKVNPPAELLSPQTSENVPIIAEVMEIIAKPTEAEIPTVTKPSIHIVETAKADSSSSQSPTKIESTVRVAPMLPTLKVDSVVRVESKIYVPPRSRLESTVQLATVPPKNSATVAPPPASRRRFQRSSLARPPPNLNPAPRSNVLSRIGAVLKRKASNHSDDDGNSKFIGGAVASVVKVKPRPKLPAASQPPKNLLLRAMADAEKSIAKAPPREIPVSNKERTPLFTRRYREKQGKRGLDLRERIAITLPNVRNELSKDDVNTEEEEEDEDMEEEEEEETEEEAYVPEVVTSPSLVCPPAADIIYSPTPKKLVVEEPSAKVEVEEIDFQKGTSLTTNETTSIRSITPEFLVTLDGYQSFNKTSRTVVCLSPERDNRRNETGEALPTQNIKQTIAKESQETQKLEKPGRKKIVFDAEPENASQEKLKKPVTKSLDRCKFWPACRQGDACPFHHPTQTCKAFPLCSFGDRCLYIHPNCKFDASCSRKDCPFTHASPRSHPFTQPSVIAAPPRPIIQKLGSVGPICRFFPNCSNLNCRFFHPKPCRFGRQCKKSDCTYSHGEIPPKEKMKWVSSSTLVL